MANILLIEPDYKNKYPPLGLMKISYFHKHIMHDYVRFTKGRLPEALSGTKWDKVYVTTLFTFEWERTIEAIEYAKTLVDSIDQVSIGGIASTMMPEDFYRATGIRPVTGLLNEPGKLGLPGDECIDQITPDYAMLEDVDYIYPAHNAYFLSATKGCGNRCDFCAVQTLEPKFVPYINIKEKVAAIDAEFGPKKDLLLMDNNVLRSPQFDRIIDDIIEAGFGKGAMFINPKTGKQQKRIVDFNQGLDALFLTEAKAKRLGEIALSPARIAFDHIEDKERYDRALRLCAKYGITELSNYVLYNGEDFGGKGQKYHADTPEDLYDRMRITLDITDDINREKTQEDQVESFSFPMRYIPLNAHKRGFIGTHWNKKQLRAVQTMLVPTQGKGVSKRAFFEADFGKNSSEFVRALNMPEVIIGARGVISRTSHGNVGESDEVFALRKKEWETNQKRLAEWNRLYDLLGEEASSFTALIGDNEFVPEKFLTIASDTQKKLYLHYLSTARLFSLIGLLDRSSPTYQLVYRYITEEFPILKEDMLSAVTTNESLQNYALKNFIAFFGREGLREVLAILAQNDFDCDKILARWDSTFKKEGIGYLDFELVRVYRRFVAVGALDEKEHERAHKAICEMNTARLALTLQDHMPAFEAILMSTLSDEKGQAIIKAAMKTVMDNLQFKIFDIIGE